MKIKGKNCIISPGKIVQVACKTNVGCLTSPQPMIFQQGEGELPKRLKCADSVIMLKPGAKNYFQIPVSNSSNCDIVLKENTIVGRAEYMSSIIPLQVKFNSYKISVSSIHTKEEEECNASIAVRKRINQNTSTSQPSRKRRQKLYRKQQQTTSNRY